jgi:hypothetical protein
MAFNGRAAMKEIQLNGFQELECGLLGIPIQTIFPAF